MFVGLSARKRSADIRAALGAWFPDVAVGELRELPSAASQPRPPIVFALDHNPREFPLVVTFYDSPGQTDGATATAAMIEVARRFAETYHCRAICDGTGYGDDDSPCWSIVWDSGRSYLADDCGTIFGDGEGGPVRVVREIAVVPARLDRAARIEG